MRNPRVGSDLLELLFPTVDLALALPLAELFLHAGGVCHGVHKLRDPDPAIGRFISDVLPEFVFGFGELRPDLEALPIISLAQGHPQLGIIPIGDLAGLLRTGENSAQAAKKSILFFRQTPSQDRLQPSGEVNRFLRVPVRRREARAIGGGRRATPALKFRTTSVLCSPKTSRSTAATCAQSSIAGQLQSPVQVAPSLPRESKYSKCTS